MQRQSTYTHQATTHRGWQMIAIAISVLFMACPSKADAGTTRMTLAAKHECPPHRFDSVAGFDLRKYSAAPWYPQQQVPNVYQQPDTLYCVRAVYELVDANDLQKGVVVNNYANTGKVNGPSRGTSGSGGSSGMLVALPDEKEEGPTAASKLRVGPKALQKLPKAIWYSLYGPYWVVAVGASKNATLGYDWAIVLGGTPDACGKTGCKPGLPLVPSKYQYFGGLWLFSRKPVDPAGTKVMLKKLKQLGLDSSELLTVQQKGCTYQGA